MGRSVDAYIYNANELIAAFKRDGAHDEAQLREALGKFGTFIGDDYLLVNNEFYDGDNPYYGLSPVLRSIFTYTGSEDGFFDTYLRAPRREAVTCANASDVACEIGIELNEE